MSEPTMPTLRFATPEAWSAHAEDVKSELRALFAQKTVTEWRAQLATPFRFDGSRCRRA